VIKWRIEPVIKHEKKIEASESDTAHSSEQPARKKAHQGNISQQPAIEAEHAQEKVLSESVIDEPAKKEVLPTKKDLMEELEKVRKENKELSERLLRTLAEFDNYRKRVTREKEDLVACGTEKLALALLPVLDNFERACDQAHTAQEVSQVVEGIEMILKQLRETLEKFNIKPFSATGEPFDPEKHEAIAQQEHATYPPNTVTAEIQKGYYVGEKLLRPARVIVAREPELTQE